MDESNSCPRDVRVTKFVKEHVEDYCAGTTIHGVQYLAEKGRPFSERIWWVVVFLICLMVNIYMISKIWHKWNNSPVIVSFSEQLTPVWEIPFPAVTICSLATFSTAEYNIRAELAIVEKQNSSSQELADVSLLCRLFSGYKANNITFASDNVTDLFKDIAFDPDEIITHATWRTENILHRGFSKIVTEEGICYTFNMINSAELFKVGSGRKLFRSNKYERTSGWSMEDGYYNKTLYNEEFKQSYPYRSANSGLKEGFEILLGYDVSTQDYLCHGPTPGFKVTLHHPAQYPSVSEKYFVVPLDRESIISVVPDIMKTSESLRSYSPQDRQCYFAAEKQLAYFNIYTQDNCEFECLMNLTMHHCGCIAFYMPRVNKSVPICGLRGKHCIEELKWNMNKLLIDAYYDKNLMVGDDCTSCLPSCTNIKYHTDVTQSEFEVNILLEELKKRNPNFTSKVDFETIKKKKYSFIKIYFPEKYFTSSKRSELYGITDFVANCGGLLSLFSGLSLLSVVEIFYYLTLRCFNNMRKRHGDELLNVEMGEMRLKDA